MPVHDWSRGDDSLYHNFHLGWPIEVAGRLNGMVEPAYFAMTETWELRPTPGFCHLPEPDKDVGRSRQPPGTDEPPPACHHVLTDTRVQYAFRAVTVRRADHHQPVAAVMWVTRQDKETPYRLRAVVRHAVAALTHGVGLVLIDLFPPTPLAPAGVHGAVWEDLAGRPDDSPADRPFAVVSYDAERVAAHVHPLAVGDPLPAVPLFLDGGRHVMLSLGESYRAAWDVLPRPLRVSDG
jgi:hypothetical protein